MTTDNQPTPDDGYRKAWQQAFDKADDSPPPRVWNAIERQLDAGNRARVIPLWVQVRPWATGIAATVAIVLTGWWAWQALLPALPVAQTARQQPDRSVATSTHTGTQAQKSKSIPVPVSRPVESAGRVNVAKTNARNRSSAGTESPLYQTIPGPVTVADNRLTVADADARYRVRVALSGPVVVHVGRAVVGRQANGSGDTPAIPIPFGAEQEPASALLVAPTKAEETGRVVVSVGALSGKAFRNRSLGIQRVVWFRNEESLSGSIESKSVKRQKWVSASIMPSSFNPVAGSQQASVGVASSSNYQNVSVTPTRAASFRSESGRAITLQLSAGAQLSNRWSVEAGVGYLQAQSTVVSSVQTAAIALDGTGKTYYTAVIQRAVSRNSTGASVNDLNSALPVQYATGQEGRTRNDYNFVQVPVQIGYQLRPRRKLGLSVLGGLLTNLFVRNTVGETLDVKPSDHVYRSVTLAGTAGARLRYRSSPRWSASMAGVYQQALQTGTQSDVNLETHPQAVGVSFGVDYHF